MAGIIGLFVGIIMLGSYLGAQGTPLWLGIIIILGVVFIWLAPMGVDLTKLK